MAKYPVNDGWENVTAPRSVWISADDGPFPAAICTGAADDSSLNCEDFAPTACPAGCTVGYNVGHHYLDGTVIVNENSSGIVSNRADHGYSFRGVGNSNGLGNKDWGWTFDNQMEKLPWWLGSVRVPSDDSSTYDAGTCERGWTDSDQRCMHDPYKYNKTAQKEQEEQTTTNQERGICVTRPKPVTIDLAPYQIATCTAKDQQNDDHVLACGNNGDCSTATGQGCNTNLSRDALNSDPLDINDELRQAEPSRAECEGQIEVGGRICVRGSADCAAGDSICEFNPGDDANQRRKGRILRLNNPEDSDLLQNGHTFKLVDKPGADGPCPYQTGVEVTSNGPVNGDPLRGIYVMAGPGRTVWRGSSSRLIPESYMRSTRGYPVMPFEDQINISNCAIDNGRTCEDVDDRSNCELNDECYWNEAIITPCCIEDGGTVDCKKLCSANPELCVNYRIEDNEEEGKCPIGIMDGICKDPGASEGECSDPNVWIDYLPDALTSNFCLIIEKETAAECTAEGYEWVENFDIISKIWPLNAPKCLSWEQHDGSGQTIQTYPRPDGVGPQPDNSGRIEEDIILEYMKYASVENNWSEDDDLYVNPESRAYKIDENMNYSDDYCECTVAPGVSGINCSPNFINQSSYIAEPSKDRFFEKNEGGASTHPCGGNPSCNFGPKPDNDDTCLKCNYINRDGWDSNTHNPFFNSSPHLTDCSTLDPRAAHWKDMDYCPTVTTPDGEGGSMEDNIIENTCLQYYDTCEEDGVCKKCISDEGFANQSTTYSTSKQCYENSKYRKYYDCMYGIPLLPYKESGSTKSKLGSKDITGIHKFEHIVENPKNVNSSISKLVHYGHKWDVHAESISANAPQELMEYHIQKDNYKMPFYTDPTKGMVFYYSDGGEYDTGIVSQDNYGVGANHQVPPKRYKKVGNIPYCKLMGRNYQVTPSEINTDENTITLNSATHGILVGDTVRLVSAPGQVCGATPLNEDLIVSNVDGMILTFTDTPLEGGVIDENKCLVQSDEKYLPNCSININRENGGIRDEDNLGDNYDPLNISNAGPYYHEPLEKTIFTNNGGSLNYFNLPNTVTIIDPVGSTESCMATDYSDATHVQACNNVVLDGNPATCTDVMVDGSAVCTYQLEAGGNYRSPRGQVQVVDRPESKSTYTGNIRRDLIDGEIRIYRENNHRSGGETNINYDFQIVVNGNESLFNKYDTLIFKNNSDDICENEKLTGTWRIVDNPESLTSETTQLKIIKIDAPGEIIIDEAKIGQIDNCIVQPERNFTKGYYIDEKKQGYLINGSDNLANTNQFYNFVMNNFGMNHAADINDFENNNRGILVRNTGSGSDPFEHINPLQSFYSSREISINDNNIDDSWINVLNLYNENNQRHITCGGIIDFLYSLKHISDSSAPKHRISIQDKYKDIEKNICTDDQIILRGPISRKELPTIPAITLPIDPSLKEYLKENCNICNKEKDWKGNIYNGSWEGNPGECIPNINANVHHEINKINLLQDGTPPTDNTQCMGEWIKYDIINKYVEETVLERYQGDSSTCTSVGNPSTGMTEQECIDYCITESDTYDTITVAMIDNSGGVCRCGADNCIDLKTPASNNNLYKLITPSVNIDEDGEKCMEAQSVSGLTDGSDGYCLLNLADNSARYVINSDNSGDYPPNGDALIEIDPGDPERRQYKETFPCGPDILEGNETIKFINISKDIDIEFLDNSDKIKFNNGGSITEYNKFCIDKEDTENRIYIDSESCVDLTPGAVSTNCPADFSTGLNIITKKYKSFPLPQNRQVPFYTKYENDDARDGDRTTNCKYYETDSTLSYDQFCNLTETNNLVNYFVNEECETDIAEIDHDREGGGLGSSELICVNNPITYIHGSNQFKVNTECPPNKEWNPDPSISACEEVPSCHGELEAGRGISDYTYWTRRSNFENEPIIFNTALADTDVAEMGGETLPEEIKEKIKIKNCYIPNSCYDNEDNPLIVDRIERNTQDGTCDCSKQTYFQNNGDNMMCIPRGTCTTYLDSATAYLDTSHTQCKIGEESPDTPQCALIVNNCEGNPTDTGRTCGIDTSMNGLVVCPAGCDMTGPEINQFTTNCTNVPSCNLSIFLHNHNLDIKNMANPPEYSKIYELTPHNFICKNGFYPNPKIESCTSTMVDGGTTTYGDTNNCVLVPTIPDDPATTWVVETVTGSCADVNTALATCAYQDFSQMKSDLMNTGIRIKNNENESHFILSCNVENGGLELDNGRLGLPEIFQEGQPPNAGRICIDCKTQDLCQNRFHHNPNKKCYLDDSDSKYYKACGLIDPNLRDRNNEPTEHTHYIDAKGEVKACTSLLDEPGPFQNLLSQFTGGYSISSNYRATCDGPDNLHNFIFTMCDIQDGYKPVPVDGRCVECNNFDLCNRNPDGEGYIDMTGIECLHYNTIDDFPSHSDVWGLTQPAEGGEYRRKCSDFGQVESTNYRVNSDGRLIENECIMDPTSPLNTNIDTIIEDATTGGTVPKKVSDILEVMERNNPGGDTTLTCLPNYVDTRDSRSKNLKCISHGGPDNYFKIMDGANTEVECERMEVCHTDPNDLNYFKSDTLSVDTDLSLFNTECVDGGGGACPGGAGGCPVMTAPDDECIAGEDLVCYKKCNKIGDNNYVHSRPKLGKYYCGGCNISTGTPVCEQVCDDNYFPVDGGEQDICQENICNIYVNYDISTITVAENETTLNTELNINLDNNAHDIIKGDYIFFDNRMDRDIDPTSILLFQECELNKDDLHEVIDVNSDGLIKINYAKDSGRDIYYKDNCILKKAPPTPTQAPNYLKGYTIELNKPREQVTDVGNIILPNDETRHSNFGTSSGTQAYSYQDIMLRELAAGSGAATHAGGISCKKGFGLSETVDITQKPDIVCPIATDDGISDFEEVSSEVPSEDRIINDTKKCLQCGGLHRPGAQYNNGDDDYCKPCKITDPDGQFNLEEMFSEGECDFKTGKPIPILQDLEHSAGTVCGVRPPEGGFVGAYTLWAKGQNPCTLRDTGWEEQTLADLSDEDIGNDVETYWYNEFAPKKVDNTPYFIDVVSHDEKYFTKNWNDRYKELSYNNYCRDGYILEYDEVEGTRTITDKCILPPRCTGETCDNYINIVSNENIVVEEHFCKKGYTRISKETDRLGQPEYFCEEVKCKPKFFFDPTCEKCRACDSSIVDTNGYLISDNCELEIYPPITNISCIFNDDDRKLIFNYEGDTEALSGAYGNSDLVGFGKCGPNQVYYNQRRHEDFYCKSFDEDEQGCKNDGRCQYNHSNVKCIGKVNIGYDTCCHKVDFIEDSAFNNYICKDKDDVSWVDDDILKLETSECGLIDIGQGLAGDRCNSIKDSNGNPACEWDGFSCSKKSDTEDIKHTCKKGFVFSDDMTLPFCCVDTRIYSDDIDPSINNEWLDEYGETCKIGYTHFIKCSDIKNENGCREIENNIPAANTKKCKWDPVLEECYGTENDDRNHNNDPIYIKSCIKPWIENESDEDSDEALSTLSNVEVKCSINQAIYEVYPKNEKDICRRLVKEDDLIKSFTGDPAARASSNPLLKLQGTSPEICSEYNCGTGSDTVLNEVCCGDCEHFDCRYKCGEDGDSEDNLFKAKCSETDETFKKCCMLNEDRYCDGQVINTDVTNINLPSVDTFCEQDSTTAIFVPSIFINDTDTSKDDIFCKEDYYDATQYIVPDESDQCLYKDIILQTNLEDEEHYYTNFTKNTRINERYIMNTHDKCLKSVCEKPYNSDYIDINPDGYPYRIDINKEHFRDNISCSPNAYEMGERYLLHLIKTNDLEFVKIYIKNEMGDPIIAEGDDKINGLFYKIKVPQKVHIGRKYTVSLPILLVQEELDDIQEYDFDRVREIYGDDYTNRIEIINRPIAICNESKGISKGSDEGYYELDGCSSVRKTCRDWADDNPDFVNIVQDNEAYCVSNNHLIDLNRNINFYDDISDSIKNLEEICCNDRTCTSYQCPINYKQNTLNNNEFIFNDSGISVPLQKCCIKKTCDDWISDGNNCGGAVPISNKIGYSNQECCFETCGNWNERTIKEKIKERFPSWDENNLLPEGVDLTNEGSIQTYIQDLSLTHTDNGTPTEFLNCNDEEYLISDKQGSDTISCCTNKRNSCLYKEWECPENTFTDTSKSLEKCLTGGINECSETPENIELCCAPYQKCNALICPTGYENNPQKINYTCKGPTCNTTDDIECCLEKEKCSDMKCGLGYQQNESRNDIYCKGLECSLIEDRTRCCMKNETCSDMECPMGYYQKEENSNKNCYGGTCSVDNRLDMLKCCKECKPLENASKYTCYNNTGSLAIECNEGYTLMEGKCLKPKELLDVSISLDGDYNSFINTEDYEQITLNSICGLLNDGITTEQCLSMFTIKGYREGSLIIDLQITNEENGEQRIEKEEIQRKFAKDIFIDGINMKVKEEPIIVKREIEENTQVKCFSGIYKHKCPFGTMLKQNSTSIYGTTHEKCCELDWEILKIVIPAFLVGLLFVIIVYKKTLGKIK